jgi:integrase
MALKKVNYEENEEMIFDGAIIYTRGKYYQFRMWLTNERKYARFSLKTTNHSTAKDKAKLYYHELMAKQLAGKTYFSKTTKQGVEQYLTQRQLDVDAGLIVKGRLGTIKIHLNHWLEFIGRDTKLKELERTDCENYFLERTKKKKGIAISQATVVNEQSSINAMISWLFKRNETYIEAYDFKKLKKIDRGDEALRRSMFEVDEINKIKEVLVKYISDAKRNISEKGNLIKALAGYYFLISILTGLRRGEQLQLKWKDIKFLEKNIKGEADDDEVYSLVKITVWAETSKVRKTRSFIVVDWEYFDELQKLLWPRYVKSQGKENLKENPFGNTCIFSKDGSKDGIKSLTPRIIEYHFDKIVEMAGIVVTDERDLVPYSFRHYFITNMINRGFSLIQVAEMCGTSVAQIEKTYYHTTETKMINNALPNFEYIDGLLVPK